MTLWRKIYHKPDKLADDSGQTDKMAEKQKTDKMSSFFQGSDKMARYLIK
jgi:hypothetical protein